MTRAGSLVRQRRRASALTQRQLATCASTSQPRIAAIETGAHDTTVDTLDRLLGSIGSQVIAVDTRRQTAADIADQVYDLVRSGDTSAAFRRLLQLNDDLAREDSIHRVVLTATAPPLVGERRYDAFIAALAEHYLTLQSLPIPRWTEEPERFCQEPWFVAEIPGFEEDALATSPPSFVRRGIYVNASELQAA